MDMPLCLCRWLFLGVFLLSAAGVAQAQTLKLLLASSNAEQVLVSRSSCSARFSMRWELTSNAYSQICAPGLRVWATTSTCKDTGPGETDIELFTVNPTDLRALSGTATPTQPLEKWPGFQDKELPCGLEGPEGVRVEHRICGLIPLRNSGGISGGNCDEKMMASALSIVYKTSLPPAPVIESGEGYDGEATLHFSLSGESLSKVLLYGRLGTDTEAKLMAEVAATASNIRVSGLENDIPYVFFLRVVDSAGNESPDSNTKEVISVPTRGFWDIYKENGGTESGCQTVGGGLWVGLALAVLGLGMRRRLW